MPYICVMYSVDVHMYLGTDNTDDYDLVVCRTLRHVIVSSYLCVHTPSIMLFVDVSLA